MQSRNQFLEIVAVGERYLIINDAQNKESKRQPFRITLSRKISRWENVSRLGKNFFNLNLQYFQFEQDDWENRASSIKDNLIMNL